MTDFETVIIGAGVIGLATARELAMAGRDVLLVEQHGLIGSETSARNSEVVHAGIYYPHGSLKAQLCVEGRDRLYEFCCSHGVAHRKLGKLIVATDAAQVGELAGIAAHAHANGVGDLKQISKAEAQELEPELSCMAALLSPSTGIIDSLGFMLALQGDAEAHGCQISFDTQDADPTIVTTRELIISGGLHSSQFINSAINAAQVGETYYAKGNYFRLNDKAPFSRLIYPVPEPGGLGVHITIDLGGQARFGPDVEWIDEIRYEVDAARSQSFYAAIRRYWPGLRDNTLEPDYSGIRPKLGPQGKPAADFTLWSKADHGMDGLIGLLGIESPGLTSSLAIAHKVRQLL